MGYGKTNRAAEFVAVPAALSPTHHAEDARILLFDPSREITPAIDAFCQFLDLRAYQAETSDDLATLLEETQPIALLWAVEPGGIDALAILKRVAAHDTSLPVLMVTGEYEALRYLEMVEESWGLTAVLKAPDLPPARVLMDFLCRAGLKSGKRRLIPS